MNRMVPRVAKEQKAVKWGFGTGTLINTRKKGCHPEWQGGHEQPLAQGAANNFINGDMRECLG